ncbi:MAG: LytTR family DNA-binding domain-containing protein [Bacteroidia bacterium]|nr:LytTR family DNA-binding domain-containing protein [Bacteroidia bacterium]
MKRIPRVVLTDYICYSVGFFLFIVLLEPFGTRDFIKTNVNPYSCYVIAAICFFLILLFCELITSVLCRLPADYSQPKEYQVKRLLCFVIPCMLIYTVYDGESFVIRHWGWDHLDWLWRDQDGSVTFKRFFHDLKEAVSVGAFIIAYQIFVTHNRMQRYQIEELQSLNNKLEAEFQTMQDTTLPVKVQLHGQSQETIILNPSDILYIESVANYVNIVYFSGQDLSQKRLRCPLHDIEETLSPYSFIFHIHRAFLVNLNFITQVSGNAAGYKLQIFGSDKVLPVSKANVPAFREKVLAKKETGE